MRLLHSFFVLLKEHLRRLARVAGLFERTRAVELDVEEHHVDITSGIGRPCNRVALLSLSRKARRNGRKKVEEMTIR